MTASGRHLLRLVAWSYFPHQEAGVVLGVILEALSRAPGRTVR